MAMPLTGITVLDFGQIYQGSYATLLMAKAGANVIKIEPPGGEPLRRRVVPGKQTTMPFAMLNANKRAVTLNLKTEKGKALLFEMVKRADVLLENFAPGAMDNLGVGWSVLRPLNPRLIYATASGYGITGPRKGDLAMDLTVQAASGLMSVTGYADGPPMRAGVTVADFSGGIHAYGAIMTALFERERSGEGRLVETAMLEAMYFPLAGPIESFSRRGTVPPRSGNGANGSIAPYGVFPVKDGYVAIHTGTDGHWLKILEAAGRNDLKDDPRLQTMFGRAQHDQEVSEVVTAWTATLTKAEIQTIGRKLKIPLSPVRDVSEVMLCEHMHERGTLEWVDHPDLGRVVLPTTPLRLHGLDVAPAVPSARVGAHNDEIFGGWLGLSAAELETLRAEKVI
ncbi:MAG: CoA transferase [Acetobacteraceae bacterium]|nr:CoA transferase [Acetobacteraceae bacterium]